MNLPQRWIPRALRVHALCAFSSASALAACFLVAGCAATQINQHATAFSDSLAPVVDQSADAYRDAVALHNLRGDYEAVFAYENKDASYNPRNTSTLLSEKDIQTRLAVLAALQVYSRSLIQITDTNSSPALNSASKAVGGNLTDLGNDLAPSIESILGIAASPDSTTTTVTTVSGATTTTSSTTAAAPALSPTVQNGISTAVNALGQFLVSRIVAKDLPAKIEDMDPTVQLFCKTLAGDIQALDDIEQHDYDRILNLEKQFILEDEQPGHTADPQGLRAEIMRLPEIARQQQQAHAKLAALRDALQNLALTHHALAAAAQGNNPESLTAKLNELSAAGSNLGKFYSKLSTPPPAN